MKKFIFLVLLLPVILLDYGCKDNSTEPDDVDTTNVIVRKPNLYIYPVDTLSLAIEINFPNGGDILESIPEYNDLWNILVFPNGKINNEFNYLYYECEIPDLTQKEYGWIIKKQNLEDFFSNNLFLSGFNNNETNDFIEYWIPLLVDYDYYEIYPQYKGTLEKVIEINFSKEPNNIYRLCYLIIGRNDDNLQLIEPQIERAVRLDYYAVEWGVILK